MGCTCFSTSLHLFPLYTQYTRWPSTCQFLVTAGFSFEVCIAMSLEATNFRERSIKIEHRYLATHPITWEAVSSWFLDLASESLTLCYRGKLIMEDSWQVRWNSLVFCTSTVFCMLKIVDQMKLGKKDVYFIFVHVYICLFIYVLYIYREMKVTIKFA